MALIHGPLVFFTDGTDASLAALTDVATFAATAHWRLQVLHMLSENGQSSRIERIARTLEALPSHGAALSVQTVRRNDVSRSLNNEAVEQTSVLALHLERRRFLMHVLPEKPDELLPHDWNPPVLTIPSQYRCRPITRVLFPADLAPRSMPAFDEAIGLCETLGAELHVLHVFGDDRRLPIDKDLASRQAARSPRDLLNIDRGAIQALVERANTRGIHAVANTAEGRAHAQILNYATASAIDMIFMPTHGPRTMEDIVLGTTTARVVRGATVPVMSLRSGSFRRGVSASA